MDTCAQAWPVPAQKVLVLADLGSDQGWPWGVAAPVFMMGWPAGGQAGLF